jgi:hypothetical protein
LWPVIDLHSCIGGRVQASLITIAASIAIKEEGEEERDK